MTSEKVAKIGMFTALAMIFGYIETLIPLNFGVPGMKLGLSNIVTVTALYVMGAGPALAVTVLRIFLVSMTFGNMAALMYSLAGGLLSFLGMALLKKAKGFSVVGVSIHHGPQPSIQEHAVDQVDGKLFLLPQNLVHRVRTSVAPVHRDLDKENGLLGLQGHACCLQ